MPATETTGSGHRIAIVGAGRLGRALASALHATGTRPAVAATFEAVGPLGRGADAVGCELALLCVPDREIAAAAAALAPGVIAGHCSGALGLEPLAPRECFSLHPLMTFTAVTAGQTAPLGPSLRGVAAAIDASSDRALAYAEQLAAAVAMTPLRISREHRVAYHAAACMASNFLVTVEAAAERLATSAGLSREMLGPLVRQTVENWLALGPERALTGPVARGDAETVARQRATVAARAPDLLELFDALVTATQELT
jgi:predicted short-subunit dehydrogenase-like oxidoreductase (DUF2520 family)